MSIVRVCQFNTWRESKHLTEDFERVLPHSDLVLLNEAANHKKTIEAWCKAHSEWGAIIPDGDHNQRQNCIMYRKTIFSTTGRRADVIQMCYGAGKKTTSHTPPRYMTRKRFTHKETGTGFQVRVTHMNSHVERTVWQVLPRFRQYRKQLRRMVRETKTFRSSTLVQIIGMDTNADWRRTKNIPKFPYASLRHQKMYSNYDVLGPLRQTGTHGARMIDAIFVRKSSAARMASQRVITGLASDHNALIVTLVLR